MNGDGQVVERLQMDDPSLTQLVKESHPELAAAVRSRSPRILDRFRTLIQEILPSADELTLTELLDHLPQALEDLAVAIGAAGSLGSRSFLADSRQHGVCRYHQSFNLSELLVEYSVLRSIIIEEATRALGRLLTLPEVSSLNVGIDAASRRAVESFVAYQSREIQGATDAQSKYLSFLSHDLRGSLNGILLMLEVLRRELGGTAQFQNSLEDLESMRRSIMQTVGTMDRFLHAERFRRGKVEVKLGEVNLARMLPEIVSGYIHQAKEKGVQIYIDAAQFPTIIADRELITLILQNLVSNAVKYTKQGAVRITVSESSTKGGHRISVSDQGPGISQETLKELFQPYMRGQTHGQPGLGLGLSIARQAADLMGARLWADSEIGVGSTFHLELPPPPVKA